MVGGEGGGGAGKGAVQGASQPGGSGCVAGAPTVRWSDPVQREAGGARVWGAGELTEVGAGDGGLSPTLRSLLDGSTGYRSIA